MFTSVIDRNGSSGCGGYGGTSVYGNSVTYNAAARRIVTVPYGGVTAAYLKKTARIYLLVTLFTAVFGHIYEHYSHGVYSRAMFWAFLIPLFAGTALFRALSVTRLKVMPGKNSMMFYHWGIAAFTVGSLFKGALDIYGTSNTLVNIYWVAGGALIALSLFVYYREAYRI